MNQCHSGFSLGKPGAPRLQPLALFCAQGVPTRSTHSTILILAVYKDTLADYYNNMQIVVNATASCIDKLQKMFNADLYLASEKQVRRYD